MRLCYAMLRFLARMVPYWRRGDWLQEWEAELRHSEERSMLDLFLRCCGAAIDAFWILQNEWSLDMAAGDVRQGFRAFHSYPAFAMLVVLVLALGIGVNTAVFGLVNAVILRPLPYRDSDRIVMVHGRNQSRGEERVGTSAPDFDDFKSRSHSFDDLVTITRFEPNLTGAGDAQRLHGASVSPSFFRVLGVQPVIGRDFLAGEDSAKGATVVVLSHGLWLRVFGGDPSIVGKTIMLDDVPYSVIGIAPREFRAPTEGQDLFRPYVFRGGHFNRQYRILPLIGRLKDGVSLGQAQAELHTLARQLELQYPESNAGYDAEVITIHDAIVGDVKPSLFMLLGAVSLVLLIACANIANLMLAHSTARSREMSIRLAIGASRGRIARQLVIESLLLSLAGGGLALILSYALMQTAPAIIPIDIPRIDQWTADWRVLAFDLMVSVLTGLVFGVLAAIQSRRVDVPQSLKETARAGGAGVETQRLRRVLVGVEVAIAVVLLIGAGLFIRTLEALQRVDPGFRSDGIITLQVSLGRAQIREMQDAARFFRQLIEKIRELPGVQSAGAVLQLPLIGLDVDLSDITAIGEPPPKSGIPQVARLHVVTPDYFNTIGVPLVKGRFLTDRDQAGTPGVALINQRMAERFWPGQNPIGKQFRQGLKFTPGEPDIREVVGVVGDVKQFGLGTSGEPQMYVPHEQSPWPVMNVVVKVAQNPAALSASIRATVRSLSPDVPVLNVATMDQIISQSIAQPRFHTALIGMFAALAFVLAIVGIYGMVSYTVRRRTNEIGVRIALGATAADIRRLLIGSEALPIAVGTLCGIAGAAVLTRFLASMLFGVQPLDLTTFLAVPAILLVAAVLAGYLPARRAIQVDPVIALRSN